LDEAGITTITYESTIKDGLTALETYLKNHFNAEAQGVDKTPHSTIFQRLDETNELYKRYLGLDLAAASGAEVWAGLRRAAAIRHLLTHNVGIIDQKFLLRIPEWPQAPGQRLNVNRTEVESFLQSIHVFVSRVPGPTTPPST